MTAHPSEEQIRNLYEGALPEADAAALEAHLSQCPACEERYEAYLRFRVKQTPAGPSPDSQALPLESPSPEPTGAMAGTGNETGAPPLALDAPVYLERAGEPLRCAVCKHDRFAKRYVLLNTRIASYLGFDWLNRSASCYVCSRCGYIHWFM